MELSTLFAGAAPDEHELCINVVEMSPELHSVLLVSTPLSDLHEKQHKKVDVELNRRVCHLHLQSLAARVLL
jgi:hypothetical protein